MLRMLLFTADACIINIDRQSLSCLADLTYTRLVLSLNISVMIASYLGDELCMLLGGCIRVGVLVTDYLLRNMCAGCSILSRLVLVGDVHMHLVPLRYTMIARSYSRLNVNLLSIRETRFGRLRGTFELCFCVSINQSCV